MIPPANFLVEKRRLCLSVCLSRRRYAGRKLARFPVSATSRAAEVRDTLLQLFLQDESEEAAGHVTARCDTSQNAIGGGPRKGARCLLLARHGHGRRPPERAAVRVTPAAAATSGGCGADFGGFARGRKWICNAQGVSKSAKVGAKLSLATSRKPWRRRRPSTWPVRCRSGGRSSGRARWPARS